MGFQKEVFLHFDLSSLAVKNSVCFLSFVNISQYVTILMQSFLINRNLLKHLDVKPTFFIPCVTKREDFIVYRSQKMLIAYTDKRQNFIVCLSHKTLKDLGAN